MDLLQKQKKNSNLSDIKISVVIPAYNASKYIEKTLQSIVNQSLARKKFEIIVIDDCSLDDTFNIVRKFLNSTGFPNTKVIQTESNSKGPAKPRNIGIEESIGEYIAFCDADDIWHPDKLKIQFNEFKLNDKLLGLYTTTIDFKDQNNIYYDNNIQNNIKISSTSFFQQLKKNSIKISSLIINKKFLKNIGLFDESLSMVTVEDYDLCLRILYKFPDYDFFKLKNKLTFYRLDSHSISSNKFKMFYKVLLIHLKISKFFKFRKLYLFFCLPFFLLTYLFYSVIFRIILKKS